MTGNTLMFAAIGVGDERFSMALACHKLPLKYVSYGVCHNTLSVPEVILPFTCTEMERPELEIHEPAATVMLLDMP